MKSYTLLFIIFALLISCRKPQLISKSLTARPDSNLLEEVKVDVRPIDFSFFSARSKMHYQDNQEDVTASMQIRIRKDSLIWLRVEKIGIEGLRALIRPDSIFIWDQQAKKLDQYSFDSLSRQFKFDLNFKLLQDALIGNMPFPKKNFDTFFKVKDYVLLRQNEDKIKVENYINPTTLKLQKLILSELMTGNELTVDYDNFLSENDILFAHKIGITLKYHNRPKNTSTTVIIDHQKVEFGNKELNFPFNFQKYRRKDDKSND